MITYRQKLSLFRNSLHFAEKFSNSYYFAKNVPKIIKQTISVDNRLAILDYVEFVFLHMSQKSNRFFLTY